MRAFFFIALVSIAGSAGAKPIDFNRDVRPILSDKCFKCHGPDAENQKSDFRLDSLAHATADLGGYSGIVPGDLEASEAHARIHSDDPIDQMPPPEAKMPLTAGEIEILDRWIESGAEYAPHWAFVPVPGDVPVPQSDAGWVKNDIDRFILERLEEEGLAPMPETSRERWLRRVTFDLTGLPPSLEELDAFLADESPGAHEAVVDRLLSSEAAAERLTAEWMDVARYSDSYGFQVDRDRSVWPWRDWVIGAFRRNLPYDQFITWQLAGDLLPGAGREQILATAFNRLHPQKAEGGSVPEEFRIEYVSDRVHTYGTAFLGLTMECSRCHDHKYDPITARDYYALSAFFDNLDEAGLYSFFTPAVPTPTLWLPDAGQERELEALEGRIAAAERDLETAAAESGPDFVRWVQEHPAPPVARPVAAFSFDRWDDGKFANLIAEGKPAVTNANNTLVPGKSGQAVRLTGDDALTLPVGNFTRDDAFAVALWIEVPAHLERAVIFSRSKAWTDAASRGYELLLEEGKLSAALIHFEPGNALRVRSLEPLPLNEWKHVALTYDGSSRAAGLRLFVDGDPVEVEVVRDALTREITGGGSDTIVIGERMRDSGFKNGLVDEVQVFARGLGAAEVATLAGRAADWDLESYLLGVSESYGSRLAALKALREARSELVKKIPEIMVMEEADERRPTWLLGRGHYENRVERVTAETPQFLPPMPREARRDRLGLAGWTVAESNPLTARVAVNRYWQMLFRTGLVATSEDFGSQGEPPSHPELLDWLAREFISSGWDLRHLLKTIVVSATYRQGSEITIREAVELDPENALLWRYPAPRLSAEAIRDNALAVSGLLVPRVGGPSVKPYDIAVSFKPSEPDKGEGLYRRSLYTYWKQTAPAPLMTTLDASRRDVCRVRLEKTDSPLQGLVMLNAPQFVEAARTLAARLVAKHGDGDGDGDEALIVEAFRWLTSRHPDAAEMVVLKRLMEEQESHYAVRPEEAARLISVGASPAPEEARAARVAAVTALVSTLMNFDECVTKR